MKIEEFTRSLTDSGLMTNEEVQEFIDCLPLEGRPVTGEQLAQELYRSRKLTKFQAQAIHQGKTRGLVVGNYVVLDRLGKGGMGQVYKATHKRMKRTVALKILPSSAMKSGESVKRFQREVEAAAKLSHPNIVTAYDADEAKGVHFLVMECVDGQDLSSLVKTQGPLPLEKAIDYALQAAKGLAYAHSQGIVHRDIKPANLLLDKAGVVKVLDMGLARIEHAVSAADSAEEDDLTRSGEVMGTFDYMSPEQGLDTKTADLRADIYSLGCTLYALLVGHAVYRGDTMLKKMLAHRDAPIPSIGEARSGVPESLDAVFRRMVAKRPEDRQQSMSEVIADLQNCLLGVQKDARERSSSPKANEETRTYCAEPHADTQPPPSPPPLSPLDELFAEQPVNITQRLLAPSRRTAFGKGARQKWIIAAAFFGAAVLTVFVGAMISMRTDKETKASAGRKQASAPASSGSPPSAPEFPMLADAGAESKPGAGSATAGATADADREAALWILGKGGTVHVTSDGQSREVKSISELPNGAIKVTRCDLSGNAALGDEVFDRLKGLRAIWILGLNGTKVTGKGIERLQGANYLRHLFLERTQVTDATLKNLSGFTALEHLWLGGTAVTDAGLEHLGGLGKLEFLSLGSTRVTGAGLQHLRGLKTPLAVDLAGAPVTDAGLESAKHVKCLVNLSISACRGVGDAGIAHLKELPNLKEIAMHGTQVSDAGLKYLEGLPLEILAAGWNKARGRGLSALKGLKRLEIGGPLVNDATLEELAGLTKLEILEVSASVTEVGLRHLTRIPSLKSLGLHAASVSDKGLEILKGLQNLTELNLDGTKVTAAGIAALKGALPKCKITVGPAVQADLDKSKAAAPSAGAAAADREAAQWVLARGGTLHVTGPGVEPVLKSLAKIPPGEFSIYYCDLSGCATVGDELLERIVGLTDLNSLLLAGTRVTGEGLNRLKNAGGMRVLDLSGTQMNDATSKNLGGLPMLEQLFLENTAVSDAGLQHLSGLEKLGLLQLDRTRVTGTGLQHLRGVKSPLTLSLGGAPVTDASLENVKQVKCLVNLSINGCTTVTDAGIAHLKELPNLKGLAIHGTQVSDAGLASLRGLPLEGLSAVWTKATCRGFAGLKGLRRLEIGGPPVTDAALEDLAGLTKLESLTLSGNSVTDGGLRHLMRIASLKTVEVANTAVTAAGVAALQAALPKCKIIVSTELQKKLDELQKKR